MPTKNEMIWKLVGYGLGHKFFPYVDQLFDRHIKSVRETYTSAFNEIPIDGNAFDYTYPQAMIILHELRILTEDQGNITGHNLIQRGCSSESITRAMEEYREKIPRE